MQLLITKLLSLFFCVALAAPTMASTLEQADDEGSYKLTCQYAYKSIYHRNKQIKTISMFATENLKGIAQFSSKKRSLHAYYFNPEVYPPTPVWHDEARMDFNATLQDGLLTYNFKFYNYLFSKNSFQALFNETREVDVSSIFNTSQATFEFSSGRLLDQEVNFERWVNKDSVTIVSCVLDAF